MYAVNQVNLLAEKNGRHVARRHRWAHVPAIHVASLVDHKKRFTWFSISLHTCGSVPIVMKLRLTAPHFTGNNYVFATLVYNHCCCRVCISGHYHLSDAHFLTWYKLFYIRSEY